MKKILLSLGVVASFTAPVVLAVSCGNNSDTTTDDKKTVSNQEGTITLKYEGTTVTSIEVNNFQGDLNQMMAEVMILATSKNITPEAGVNPITLVHVTGNDNLAQAVQAEVESLSHPVPPVDQPAPVQETPDTTTQTGDTSNVQPAPIDTTTQTGDTSNIQPAPIDTTTQTNQPVLSDQELVDNEATRIESIQKANITATWDDFAPNGTKLANGTVITQTFATSIGLGQLNNDYTYKISNIVRTNTIKYEGFATFPAGDTHIANPATNDVVNFEIVVEKGQTHSTPAVITNLLLSSKPAVTEAAIGAQLKHMFRTTSHEYFDFTVHSNDDEISTLMNNVNGVVASQVITSTNEAIIYFAFPTNFGTLPDQELEAIKAKVSTYHGSQNGMRPARMNANGTPSERNEQKWKFQDATGAGIGNNEFEFDIANRPLGWTYGSEDLNVGDERIVITFKTSTSTPGFDEGWWHVGDAGETAAIMNAGMTQNGPIMYTMEMLIDGDATN